MCIEQREEIFLYADTYAPLLRHPGPGRGIGGLHEDTLLGQTQRGTFQAANGEAPLQGCCAVYRFGKNLTSICHPILTFFPVRASKPSGVRLVLPLTWRSKAATGDSSLTTATRKPRRGRLFPGSATQRSCATLGSLPAGSNPLSFAFGETSFVTAPRTAATVQMKLLAVGFVS